jgi:hypothetical protein
MPAVSSNYLNSGVAIPKQYGDVCSEHDVLLNSALIYRRTKNLGAVQLLLGHSKLESTVRYLRIEVDDALEISE